MAEKVKRPWKRNWERCDFCTRRVIWVNVGNRTEGKEACDRCYQGLGEKQPRPLQPELGLE